MPWVSTRHRSEAHVLYVPFVPRAVRACFLCRYTSSRVCLMLALASHIARERHTPLSVHVLLLYVSHLYCTAYLRLCNRYSLRSPTQTYGYSPSQSHILQSPTSSISFLDQARPTRPLPAVLPTTTPIPPKDTYHPSLSAACSPHRPLLNSHYRRRLQAEVPPGEV